MTFRNSSSTCTDTIYALSSGAGRAGVAVVRVSGAQTKAALIALAGALPEPRRATLRRLRSPPGVTVAGRDVAAAVADASAEPSITGTIDQALVLWLPGPASYTGEDTAELHVHGGRAVIEATLAALGGQPGLRLAEPGEFTRRAFLNGKLDLTSAEGIADLIDAETETQRRQAMRQAGGALAALFEGWRHDLIEAMALLEASLDFADEGDVPSDVAAPAWKTLATLADTITRHLDDGRRGEILRDGLHVVLAGAPNVGKSSLLNAHAQRDVAIVSPEAGTTRDVIEVRLDLGGYPVVLTDTAGVRSTDEMARAGAVELEGIRRTLVRAGTGDLILWVTEPGAPNAAMPPAVAARGPDVHYVCNKCDLMQAAPCDPTSPRPIGVEQPILVSATTGAGLDGLVTMLTQEAQHRLGDQAAPLVTRARHRQELECCLTALRAALSGDRAALELRAEDARIAATALGRITGRVDVEDILDRIFAGFCIGK